MADNRELPRDEQEQESDAPRFPPDNLRVDYGKPCTGSSNPMPPERRAAYEERILASAQAQADGMRLAGKLFVGRG